MLSALSPHAMGVRKYALQGVVRDLGRGRLVPCMGTKRVVYRERAGGAGERGARGVECAEGVGVVEAVERAGVGGGGGRCSGKGGSWLGLGWKAWLEGLGGVEWWKGLAGGPSARAAQARERGRLGDRAARTRERGKRETVGGRASGRSEGVGSAGERAWGWRVRAA